MSTQKEESKQQHKIYIRTTIPCTIHIHIHIYIYIYILKNTELRKGKRKQEQWKESGKYVSSEYKEKAGGLMV